MPAICLNEKLGDEMEEITPDSDESPISNNNASPDIEQIRPKANRANKRNVED